MSGLQFYKLNPLSQTRPAEIDPMRFPESAPSITQGTDLKRKPPEKYILLLASAVLRITVKLKNN